MEQDKKQISRAKKLFLIIVLPVVLIIGGAGLYLFSGRYVSTDNAYVKADKTPISSEITGRAVEILVKDNTSVTKGQVMLRLDPEPFKLVVAQDEATLANVATDIKSMKAEYLKLTEDLKRAEDNLAFQERDYKRYAKLSKDIIAASVVDQMKNKRDDAAQSRDAIKQEMAAQLARLGDDYAAPIESHPRYLEAKAKLDKAKWDLSHVDLIAPTDGTVANVTAQVGEYIISGMPLFSLVQKTTPWIEANFKETDLENVRPGQSAEIEIDAYVSRKLHAVVSSITPATGSEFSILPAQNSSGNWVKVVQRVMVKLELKDYDNKMPLALGMSSYVTIDTGNTHLSRLTHHTN